MNYEFSYIQSVLSSVWPEWRLSKLLGKGSYGAVYEIIRDDLGSGYKCALKVMEMRAEDLELTEDVTVQISAPYPADPQGSYGRSASSSPPRIYSTLARREGFRQGSLAQGTSAGPGSFPGETQTELLEDFVRGVSREIDLMMQLKGTPNVVSIEDYTVLRGSNIRTILIRMELLRGVDKIAASGHGMDRSEVIRLGMDICSALEVCEKKNILHRDIKPSNIFFSENAGYKLGDFGISRTLESLHEKMSMTGIGTVQYMAPEVYQGEKYNHTIDIYSLGLTLYTLLNNNIPPFYSSEGSGGEGPYAGMSASGGRSAGGNSNSAGSAGSSGTGSRSTGSSGTNSRREANMKRLRGEPLPAPANADSQLSSVILTACNPDPSMRFRNASAFRNALADCLKPTAAPVADGKSEPGPGGGNPPSPINKYLLAAAIALLALAVVLAGGLFFNRSAGSGKPSAGSGTEADSETEASAGPDAGPSQEPLNGEDAGTGEQTGSLSASGTDSGPAEEPDQEETASEETAGLEEETDPEGGTAGAEDIGHEEISTIQWADQKLEAAVKEQLGISGDLTPDQAAGVSTLDLKSSYLTDISDLRYFTGLQTLDLADNYIEDLSPLSGMTGLHDLNLENNNSLTDISPLEGMTELRRLDLYRDKVSDLSALAGMTKLTILDVRENNISDISACRDMVSMKELYLSTNSNLSDISPVSGMTSLWYLGAKNTKVSDLSPLKTIDSLTTLVLANTNVTSLDPVRNLPNLSFLDIRGCSIKSTDALNQLRTRKGLEISE